MALTDTQIRKALKPKDKPYKKADDKGLYLLVNPDKSKWWRFKYRFEGKEKSLSLGVYPDVGLKQARDRRDEARRLLADGIDPSARRHATKAAKSENGVNTFQAIATQWHGKVTLVESTRVKHLSFFENDVFPWIGRRPIAELTAPDLLAIIKRIEARGALDVARRVHNLCGRVFRYAVGYGLCDRDPSRDIELRDILPPTNVQHHASVTDPNEVGALLRAIDGFKGTFVTRCALRLSPMLFVRPGELRHAEWTEFDFAKAEWRIPAEKMKMREQHIVPLSKQAVAILNEIKPLTGHIRYVFPGGRTRERPMSENTVNAALRRMGYAKDEMTGHGFRSIASTLLHELGCEHAVIERQLAHGERNKVSAAYNHAEHLPARRKMMQQWADYLDNLRNGANVRGGSA